MPDQAVNRRGWLQRGDPTNSFAVDHTRAWTGMWVIFFGDVRDRTRSHLGRGEGLGWACECGIHGLDSYQCLYGDRHDDYGVLWYKSSLQHRTTRDESSIDC